MASTSSASSPSRVLPDDPDAAAVAEEARAAPRLRAAVSPGTSRSNLMLPVTATSRAPSASSRAASSAVCAATPARFASASRASGGDARVARRRARREPRVHEEHRDLPGAALGQQVRPDLRLEQHAEGGPGAREEAAHREARVPRAARRCVTRSPKSSRPVARPVGVMWVRRIAAPGWSRAKQGRRAGRRRASRRRRPRGSR